MRTYEALVATERLVSFEGTFFLTLLRERERRAADNMLCAVEIGVTVSELDRENPHRDGHRKSVRRFALNFNPLSNRSMHGPQTFNTSIFTK